MSSAPKRHDLDQSTKDVSIGVAISTVGRPRELARCLESLINGTRQPVEVVVVDQGTDGEIERVVAGAAEAGLHVTHVAQPRLGLGAGQNVAVAGTRTDIVAVIDDDCVAHNQWVDSIVGVLVANGGPDVVTGPVLPLPPEADRQLPVSTRTSRDARTFVGPSAPWHVGSGNNFAFKRPWFDAIGGCDARLGPGSPGRGGVDMDLFYRLLRAGAVIRYDPTAIVYHSRATPADRRARRGPYGYGMGACSMLWYRDGDRRGLRILVEWLAFRTSLLARALATRNWRAAHEEILVLGGTLAGIHHGLRA